MGTDIAVRDKRSRSGVLTQGDRSSQRSAVHRTETSDVKAHEHLIEQGCIATGARRVERIEYSAVENIHFIERHAGVESRALRSHVPDVQRQILRQFSLKLEVEILNIRTHITGIEEIEILRAAGQWNGLQR